MTKNNMTDKVGEELTGLFRRNFKEFRFQSGHREFLIRCRFCGDSNNLSSAHFYINPGDEKTPPMYHCFKCEAGGVLSPEVILEICKDKILTDLDYKVLADLTASLKIKQKNSKTNVNKLVHTIRYKISLNKTINLHEKLNYLNSRLGVSLAANDYQRLKIIFSIKELLYANQIDPIMDSKIIDELDKYFIGFLSLDNGYIIMRNINDTNGILSDYRYLNYNIFNLHNRNTMRYYCIPSQINLLSKNPIHIHIAEGCFDILSIYNRSNLKENSIFIASNGKGYYNVARLLIAQYGIYNPIFDIYPDNDVDDREIRWRMKKIYELNIPIYYHRNKFNNEKDFGVPSDRINEVIYK